MTVNLTHDEKEEIASEVTEALSSVEQGDSNKTIGFRDGHMVALFDALDETGNLEKLVDDASEYLEREAEPTRTDAMSMLVRIALAERYPDFLNAACDGYKDHLLDQVGEF